MDARRYVICDIEATGLDEHKEIIEIALITYQNDRVTEVFETLVNPLRPVPDYIHDLTSISKKELEAAPKFYEVADAIRLRLQDSIFVSHNTEFDYGLLKKKFQEMGQDLHCRTFCTLKVSQEEIPGLKSYNLDSLCHFFHIKNTDRHRAAGDASATLKLFSELQNLAGKNYTKISYLPHHEKELKKLPKKAGLLHFKNADAKVIKTIPTFDLEKTARELLVVSRENRFLLEHTELLEAQVTGMELIAEFKNDLYRPQKFTWMITCEDHRDGEKNFSVKPFSKKVRGEWFFHSRAQAIKKFQLLKRGLKSESFAYREGPKSKEEILKHNQKVRDLLRETSFPHENILILGEGRTLGERSLVLVRDHHVYGYGYTTAPEAEILESPEKFITRKFQKHLIIDLATQKYLRVIKNLKHKTESWRALGVSHESSKL